NKGIEVWSGNTQVGSISQEGGTFSGEIVNAISLQLRVPNEYLEKIILNSTDVTATLPSTTTDDPAYAGYTFYTVGNLTDVMVIEVQYNDNVPIPFATSQIRFDCSNGAGRMKNMKIWFKDGTSTSDNIERPVPFSIGWEGMRTISRIEITMHPDHDNFAYAQQYNTLGTIVDNGDGTYFYTIPGESLTSSIIPLYFPTSNYGSVKTMISSKNDFKLGYYFGEWINYEGGFLPEYNQTNTSLLNSDVTVMHYDTQNYQAQAGGYSTGIIFVQVTQGTPFRLTEDGEDCTGDCVWRDANQTFTASPLPISYTCPVAGYYYLLKNVTTDSYIIVDDGTTPLSEIESPFQVVQTITAYGDATLSLRKTDGEVVESVSNGESKSASWEKGTNMQLVVTLPANASATNYEAHLIIDGIDNILTTTTGDGGFLTFRAFDMEDVTSSHNITLITRQKGGFTPTDVTQSLLVTGEQVGKAHVFLLDDEGYTVFDNLESDATAPYTTITDSWEDVASARIYVNNVPEGYTFKAYFNGVEITGFTDPNNNGTQVATVDASIAKQDGTWVIEFKKTGFTWDVYTTGDVAIGNYIEFEVNDVELQYTGNSSGGGNVPHSTGTHSVDTPRDMCIYVTVKPGYEFKVLHNGVSVEGFTLDSSSSTSECWTYSIDEQSELLPMLTDGTWVIEFSYKNKKYDVNEDGTISIADVTKLVNKILGKE
ncbi:MAG: hypothetical protein J6Y04_01920, partial [Bacteroidaceae bacterium]|nr:hypothetical protein [Bacteroidaceae bacterium]